jgi:phenylacetate-CoA ligase
MNESRWFKLLMESAGKCAYYKRLLKEREPETFLLDDITILNKTTVKEHTKDFINSEQDSSQLIEEKSSGSTGVPLSCYRTAKEQLKLSFILHGQRRGFNRNINHDRMVQFGAFSKHMITNKHGNKKTYAFSTYYTDKSTLSFYLHKIIDINPTFIQGFPSILFSLATHAQKEGIKLNLSELSYLEARAESLTEYQKSVIEQVFQCKLANHYGSAEFWTVAYSCAYGELHIVDEAVHLEIVNKEGIPIKKGEFGEIIITGKIITSMPLIRYRIGDIGRIKVGQCRCNNPKPRIEVIGRSAEDVVTISGFKNRSLLNPLWVLLSNQNQVQIIQKKVDSFQIMYTGSAINKEKQTEVKHYMEKYIGCNELAFDQVEHIIPDPMTMKVQSFIPLHS